MKTNIRIKKVCHYCNQSFIAQKVVTKFCSLKCASRDYKKRKRDEKITNAIMATNDQLKERYSLAPVNEHSITPEISLKKEWINIGEIAELMGVSERSFYRVIKGKNFPKVKIGKRLLFNKQYVVDYFISKNVEL